MSRKPYKKDGVQMREVKEFDEEVVKIDRVTRVVKGGRKMRFRATVVIGNRKGKVGIGIGKSHEVTGAIQKAIAKAKKDMIKVPLDNATLPHDIKIKYKAARMILMPAAPGTGIIAGGTIRKVLELAGVKDILSKSLGTKNKVNTTKATFEALKQLRPNPMMAHRAKKEAEKNAARTLAKAEAPKTETKPEAPKAEATQQPAHPVHNKAK